MGDGLCRSPLIGEAKRQRTSIENRDIANGDDGFTRKIHPRTKQPIRTPREQQKIRTPREQQRTSIENRDIANGDDGFTRRNVLAPNSLSERHANNKKSERLANNKNISKHVNAFRRTPPRSARCARDNHLVDAAVFPPKRARRLLRRD